jgi:hypothetical protein
MESVEILKNTGAMERNLENPENSGESRKLWRIVKALEIVIVSRVYIQLWRIEISLENWKVS